MFQNITVNLYPTYACNLECTYCFQDNTSTEWGDVMEMQTVTDVMKKTIGYQHVNINFIGGEPTLVGLEHVDAMLVAAKNVLTQQNQPHTIQMITNGVLLDEAWFKWADDNNVYIVVSYDGAGKKHPETKKILPMLAERQKGLPVYTLANNVHTVVQKHNLHKLHATVDDLVAAGITKMFLACDVTMDRRDSVLYYDKLCELWDYINDNNINLYASLFMDLISHQNYLRSGSMPKQRYHFEMGSFNLGVEAHIMPNGIVRQTLPEVDGVYYHHSRYDHLFDYFISTEYISYSQDWLTSLQVKTGDTEVDDFMSYTRGGGLFFFAKQSISEKLSQPYVPHVKLCLRLGEYITSKPINNRYYKKLLGGVHV